VTKSRSAPHQPQDRSSKHLLNCRKQAYARSTVRVESSPGLTPIGWSGAYESPAAHDVIRKARQDHGDEEAAQPRADCAQAEGLGEDAGSDIGSWRSAVAMDARGVARAVTASQSSAPGRSPERTGDGRLQIELPLRIISKDATHCDVVIGPFSSCGLSPRWTNLRGTPTAKQDAAYPYTCAAAVTTTGTPTRSHRHRLCRHMKPRSTGHCWHSR